MCYCFCVIGSFKRLNSKIAINEKTIKVISSTTASNKYSTIICTFERSFALGWGFEFDEMSPCSSESKYHCYKG